MSYDPSPGRQPPRQGRWPNATPQEPWPAFREDEGYQAGADRQGLNRATAAVGYGSQAGASYGSQAGAGYRSQPGYRDAVGDPADYGYRGYQRPSAPDPYAEVEDGYPGAYPSTYPDAYPGAADQRAPWDRYEQDGYGPGGYSQDSYRQDPYGYSQGGYRYDGYGDGFDGAQDGFGARAGYADTAEGYRDAGRGYPAESTDYGYGGVLDAPPGSAGYGYPDAGGYAAPDDADLTRTDMPLVDLGRADPRLTDPRLTDPRLTDPRLTDPRLTAPDAGLDPDGFWSDQEDRREARRRGLAVGAVTGVLAAGVTVGVSAFTAAFFRPQASSIVDLGRALIDRMPATMKTAVMNHLGNDQAILVVGTCVSVFVLALATGVLARRAPTLGVAAIAAFSLLGAFIVITQPGSRLLDVLPAVFGGQAGVAAFLWLVSASAPISPGRQARERGARRAR